MTEPIAVPRLFVPPIPLVGLVRVGVMDAELAALLSLTVEGGIPAVVAGASAAHRRDLRDALRACLPTAKKIVRLAGADEDFAWMPEAGELGWRSGRPTLPGTPAATMTAELEDGDPSATWGEAAHLAIRALTAGYSLLATAQGSRLEEVLERLSVPPVSAIDDELARLGVVVVLDERTSRVVAVHYLRPVARDPGGHVQRLPPAVLAVWSPASGRFDHFAWGVTAELAGRSGRRPLDFEQEQARRAAAMEAAASSA